MRLIVGMTGATGAPLGVELLQALRAIPDVETHLVMSKWAKTTIELETPYTPAEVAALADYCHSPADQAATISSGSFRTDGMIIIPCSMKTLAAVSTKATLAEMLSRMENRGLVKRENDPLDKRRRFVYLTVQGQTLLAAAIPLGDRVDDEFLGRLSAEEREQFTQLVRKMMT